MRTKLYKTAVLLPLLTLQLIADDSISQTNPDFLEWQKTQQQSTQLQAAAKRQSNIIQGGLIPSPLPPKLFKGGKSPQRRVTYPAKFDLSDPNGDGNRDDSLLTPVRNQQTCGVCWSFAAYGILEGALQLSNLGSFDFSEQHMRYNNGSLWSNDDPCSGGNLLMAASYLLRGSGPVNEADDPYSLSSGSNTAAQAVRYADNIIELPLRLRTDKLNAAWFTMIKSILYEKRRPLFVTMQVSGGSAGESGNSVWEDATHSFYCVGDENWCDTNHAVVIVGWDDNYAAQGQTGAFIIRNSWGLTFKNVTDGHYYVPYNDDSLGYKGTISYADDIDDATMPITKIYQHDAFPATYLYGQNGAARYGANRFTITDDATVEAVTLYATEPDTSYEIKFFSTVSGSGSTINFSNQLGATQSSTTPIEAGYHTIKLDTPFQVTQGQTLIAWIKLQNSASALPIEADYTNYIDAESSYDESYYSSDGVNFQDLKTLMESYNIFDANFILKVLVHSSVPCNYLFVGSSYDFGSIGGERTATVSSTPDGCNTGSWSLSESLDWVALSGTTQGSGGGSWTFTYTVDETTTHGRIGEITMGEKRYTIYQEGINNTVFDERTKILWQDQPYTQNEIDAYNTNREYDKVLTWENAVDYCRTFVLLGYTDWYLPSKTELEGIIDTQYTPTIQSAFKEVQSGHYWTSTTVENDTTKAYSVNFASGDTGYESKMYSSYIRCARKPKANPSVIMYLLN